MRVENLEVCQLKLSANELKSLLQITPMATLRLCLEQAGLVPEIVAGATDLHIMQGFKIRCEETPGVSLASQLKTIAVDARLVKMGVAS